MREARGAMPRLSARRETMKHTRRIAFFLGALILLVGAGAAGAFSLWPNDLPRQPNLYRVVGYLDHAPEGVKVRDRVTIRAQGFPTRELLVTQYGTPGETTIDLELSRALGRRYAISGTGAEVARLFSIPEKQEFAALFVAYTDGPPNLVIGDLEYPVAAGG